MKNILDFPNKDSVYDSASLWLVRMDEGGLDEKGIEEFRAWLDDAPEHLAVFKDTVSTWEGMSSLKTLSRYFPIDNLNSNRKIKKKCRHKLRPLLWPVTATACLLVLAISYLFLMAGIYQTDVGEQKFVVLSDGSEMSLNTNTKLRVSFADHVRRIDLIRGEAFFDVVKDPQRPFLVIGDNKVVTAVGTAFSVLKKNSSVRVLVSEGMVHLQSSENGSEGKQSSDKAQKVALRNSVFLESGQVGILSDAQLDVKVVGSERVEQELLWRERKLVFDGETLSQVVEKFQRYTKISLIVHESVEDMRVGGYFRSDDIEGMLSSLESNFGVQLVWLDTDRILLKGSRRSKKIISDLK